VSSVSASTPCLTTRRFVGPRWTPSLSQRRGRRRSARSSFGSVSSPILAYELANMAAEAVTLLTEVGFSGFGIGFRESVVTRSVAGPKMLSFDPLNASVPEFRMPFTPTLGLSIAPLKTPHFEGTGALYLRESRDNKRIFLLTCAHVARPPVHGNTGLARKTIPASTSSPLATRATPMPSQAGWAPSATWTTQSRAGR
jgi:hypothetical protein